MNCQKCGQPLNENNQCNNCESGTVEKMSTREAENFQGITIEDESNQNYQHHQYYSEDSFRTRHQRGPTIRVFSMGGSSLSPWKKYLFFAGGVVFLLCFIFFALPFLITVVGIGLLIFMITRLLLR